MLIGLWVAVSVLSVAVICALTKLYIMKRSLRELDQGVCEKLTNSSNVPIAPSSFDADVARLAERLTRTLDEVIGQRRKYVLGNSELKNAVTNVSHDLRTPLTSVSGYLGLLRDSGLTEKQTEYLSVICGRVDAMKKLTEELLSYSVVASDEGVMAAELLCINDCLEDSLTQFYTALVERGIAPELHVCEERVERTLNREALSRIFGNILSNVVRYSAGDLVVGLDSSGNLSFENAAPDLDEVSAEKLFDRFFTVENARGSTGLGMSIAKILTEKQGGTIRAVWKNGRLKILVSF